MNTPTVALDDATDLVHRSWLAPVSKRAIPVRLRNMNLTDARDTGQVLFT